MRRDLRDRWTGALRSGLFRQGQGRLKRADDTYCCIGVLAEITGNLVTDDYGEGYVTNADWQTSYTSLTWKLRDSLGLNSDDEGTLIALNDSQYKSFAQIADWIEEHL